MLFVEMWQQLYRDTFVNDMRKIPNVNLLRGAGEEGKGAGGRKGAELAGFLDGILQEG